MVRIRWTRTIYLIVFGGICISVWMFYFKNNNPKLRQEDLSKYWPINNEHLNLRRITPRPTGNLIYVTNTTRIRLHEHQSDLEIEEEFFRFLESKDVRCLDEKRLGSQNEGGWDVCIAAPFVMRPPCLVYSFGIDNDWRFEDTMSKRYRCRILAYDPSMVTKDHDRSPDIRFRRTGLGHQNEVNRNGWILKTLLTYIEEDGFTQSPIDYLKIDIDYAEWDCLVTMIEDGSLNKVKQLGFEIHLTEVFRNDGIDIPTQKEDFLYMYNILLRLEKLGFRRYDHRRNPFGEYKSNISGIQRACCYELYYLNMNYMDETLYY